MAKTESTFINMLLVLTLICVIAGGALGYVNSITADPIAQAQAAKQVEAIEAVTAAFDNSPLEEKITQTLEDGSEVTIFPATLEGKPAGAAVEATALGFGGTIKLMVGFDADGTIRNYKVLQHAETPGLGSKMDVWFAEGGKGSIIGKNPASNNLTVSKDQGEIDAITASTITSRAFLKVIQKAYYAYMGQETPEDVNSSASTKADYKQEKMDD